MSEQTTSKKPRTRSPAYPAIDLKEALEKTETLWDRLTRHWGAADTVVTFWGYDKGSSSGYSALSALMKFGLLEDRGSGDKREVRLSDMGLKLVVNADKFSSEHRELLRKAALLPVIHAQLWTMYGGSLPDDSIVERHLILDRGFNSAYVKGFIKEFKRTISFAELTPSDTVGDTEASADSTMPSVEQKAAAPARPTTSTSPINAPRSAPPAMPLQPGMIEIPVPLPSGALAFYRVPASMTAADFDFYSTIWNAYKPGLVRPAPPCDAGEEA